MKKAKRKILTGRINNKYQTAVKLKNNNTPITGNKLKSKSKSIYEGIRDIENTKYQKGKNFFI